MVTGLTGATFLTTFLTLMFPESCVRPWYSPAVPVTCTASPLCTVTGACPVWTNSPVEAVVPVIVPPDPGVWITNPPRDPGPGGYTAVTTAGSVVTVWPARGVLCPVPWMVAMLVVLGAAMAGVALSPVVSSAELSEMASAPRRTAPAGAEGWGVGTVISWAGAVKGGSEWGERSSGIDRSSWFGTAASERKDSTRPGRDGTVNSP